MRIITIHEWDNIKIAILQRKFIGPMKPITSITPGEIKDTNKLKLFLFLTWKLRSAEKLEGSREAF